MSEITIDILSATAEIRDMLSEIMIEAVASGGMVSFMHPLKPDKAKTFWDGALASAAREERIILGAWDERVLVGTVTLMLDMPENQSHRAELIKLMTRISHRRRGIGTALVHAVEEVASQKDRTLVVLGTVPENGMPQFYESLGYQLASTIPAYALRPRADGYADQLRYWKKIGKTSS